MLVGRAAERVQLDGFVAGLPGGRSATLLIAGEAGAGKTALLDYAHQRAESTRTLAARGFEAEQELPYAALLTLLRPVEDCFERIPAPQRRALEAALGRGPPVSADRFAAYAGVLSVLAAAAEDGPVLVLVDDAHWLDSASLEALLFAARRLLDEGVGMLFTTRSGQVDDLDAAGLQVLEVQGLGADDVAALIEARTGHPPSPQAARRIWEATAGNPLAVTELSALLTQAQLDGSEPMEDPLPAGNEVRRAFGRRLEALPAESKHALLLAAADPAVTPDLLNRDPGLSALGPALARAESAGLVTLRSGLVEFRHPLVRSVTYQLATDEQRRAAHATLAKTLDPEGARTRRAWHLARAAAGPDEAVARELEAVAHAARGRVAPQAAARLLEAAAQASPSPRLRIRRLLEAAQAFGMGSHLDAARRVLDTLLREAPDDPCLRADVQRLRARLETMTGGNHHFHRMLVKEAERVLTHDPGRAASLLADAAFIAVMDGELGLSLAVVPSHVRQLA